MLWITCHLVRVAQVDLDEALMGDPWVNKGSYVER